MIFLATSLALTVLDILTINNGLLKAQAPGL
jgi:hypothetical protein